MARIIKKSSGARMCGIIAECLSHINQDALHFKEFTDDNGEIVYVGAVSDGCSGALGSENGSTFMVQTFVEEVGKLIGRSKRDSDFMRQATLNLIERMANYQPQREDTKICKYVNAESYEELAATLYAFVIDNHNALLMFAGDGSIAINDHSFSIDQKNGDLYPWYMLRLPRKDWKSKIEDFFVFAQFPMSRIRSLLIATDGFTHPIQSEYPGLINDPAMFILHAEHHATLDDEKADLPGACASRGHDDATALVFTNFSTFSDNLVTAKEVEELSAKVISHFSKKLLNEIMGSKSVLIRESARQCDPTDDPKFERNLPYSAGVHLFGITRADRSEYQKRQRQIIASRISHNYCGIDALDALFGTPSSSPPQKASSRAGSVSINKKPVDVVVAHKSVAAKTDRAAIIKASTTVVAPKDDLKPKKAKGRVPKWRQFSDLCSIAGSRRTGIGFRQFGQVMYDLWHFINNCHLQDMRIGNLRPWDILYKVNPAHTDNDGVKKSTTYAFSLANPENSAKVEKGGKLTRNYSYLDENFIHPEYLPRLSFDDQTRLDQDWYAYSVLCYWFVTKHDPFGEGIVKAKPDADRIYRMNKVILNQSFKVELDEKKDKFIQRAIGRLSPEITRFVKEFIERDFANKDPQFVLSEFKDEKIIACDALIRKGNKTTTCGFKQLDGFNTCRYCGAEHVKMIISRNAIF